VHDAEASSRLERKDFGRWDAMCKNTNYQNVEELNRASSILRDVLTIPSSGIQIDDKI
jgi:hypothetical protein